MLRVFLFIVRIPVWIAQVTWNIVVRSFLAVATLVLIAYFAATMYVTGERVFAQINATLIGSFSARHVDVSLIPTTVRLFDFSVTLPSGKEVIRAGRVEASVDSLALAMWAVKNAVGVKAPLPLHFRDVRLDDYEVVLTFRDGELELVEAFMPEVVTPPTGPPGPAPLITITNILLAQGHVLLEFGTFDIDVKLDRLAADMRIKGEESLLLVARGVKGNSFVMRGLLPPPVSFATEIPSSFEVEKVNLTLNKLEVEGLALVHPDLDLVVKRFGLGIGKGGGKVEAHGTLVLGSPGRLDELTGGHVFGSPRVDFEMFDSIKLPRFKFDVRSKELLVEQLRFEGVSARARLDLTKTGGWRIHVPQFTGDVEGGAVFLEDVLIEGGTDSGGPRVSLEGCVEGLRPWIIAERLEQIDVGTDAWQDLLVSGCCYGCAFDLPGAGGQLEARGMLSLNVDSQWLRRISGVRGAELVGYTEFTGAKVRWEGLSIVSDIGGLTSAGYVDFSGVEPEGRARCALNVFDLSWIPVPGSLGIGGTLDVEDLSLSGRVSRPTGHVRASLTGLELLGEHFESVDLEGSVDQDGVFVRRFCFRHGMNEGCLSGGTSVDPYAMSSETGIPFAIQTREPLTLDLSRLPYTSIPLAGTLTLGPTDVTGVVRSDWRRTLASISLDTTLEVDELKATGFSRQVVGSRGERAKGSAVSLKELKATIRKKPACSECFQPGKSLSFDSGLSDVRVSPRPAAGLIEFNLSESCPLGSLETEVKLSNLSASGLRVDSAVVTSEFERIPWLDTDPVSHPAGVGSIRVNAHGVRVGDLPALSGVELAVEGGADPGNLSLKGRFLFDQATGVKFAVKGDTLSRVLDLDIDTIGKLPLSLLPAGLLPPRVAVWVKDASVSLSASLRRLDLGKIMTEGMSSALRSAAGRAKLTVASLEALPEPVSRVLGSFRLSRGRVEILGGSIQLANGSRVDVKGDVDPWRRRGELAAEFSRTRLSSLKLFSAKELPVDAEIEGAVSLSGTIDSPSIEAGLAIRGLLAAGVALGDADLEASGCLTDRVNISSSSFFPGFALKEGAVLFNKLAPDRLNLVIDIKDLSLARVIPAFPSFAEVKGSGQATLHVGFSPAAQPFTLTLVIPESSLNACVTFKGMHMCLSNPSAAVASLTSTGLELKTLALAGAGQSINASGKLDFKKGWDLHVRPVVDIGYLSLLGSTFASYAGRIGVSNDSLHITGAVEAPRVSAAIHLESLSFIPRQLGSELHIGQAALMVSGSLREGDILLLIEEDAPVKGKVDEGSFSGYGWLKLSSWLPDRGLFYISGREIFYQQAGQFRVVMSPAVEIEVYDLQNKEKSGGSISGDVFISEGEFTRDFDKLLGSFATAFSRSQERYSRPMTEVFPFLARTKLDLRVHGGNFAMSSRFPFGETDLIANIDLQVKGTLDDIKLYDWIHVVPGGSITYKVVKRVFTVNRGTVDFSGDPARPYIDIEAVTEVPYSSSQVETATVGPEEQLWGKRIMIKVRLAGTYPNLTPEFSSDRPEYDVADLQTLLLLGMTRKDLEGRGEKAGGEGVSINLLTEDVAGMVSKLLLAPFVDAMSLGFTQQGGILAEAATRIGRAINLSTRVMRGGEKSEYSARIQFKITDRLMLEGRMKQFADESVAAQTQTSYEARFRYMIPLEP